MTGGGWTCVSGKIWCTVWYMTRIWHGILVDNNCGVHCEVVLVKFQVCIYWETGQEFDWEVSCNLLVCTVRKRWNFSWKLLSGISIITRRGRVDIYMSSLDSPVQGCKLSREIMKSGIRNQIIVICKQICTGNRLWCFNRLCRRFQNLQR